MSIHRAAVRDDRGETLIELLMTVIIMGIAVVALLGGIATSIRMSDIHRKQATAGTYVKAFAEAIQNAVATQNGYDPCAVLSTYAGKYSIPASDQAVFSREVTAIKIWKNGAFVDRASSCEDTGVQRVSLRVWTPNDPVAETLDITVRKPCKTTDTLCS